MSETSDVALMFDVPLRPCEPWCDSARTPGHADEHPEDRECTSPYEVLRLSNRRHPPERYCDGVWRYPWLSVYLRREYDHDEATLVLHSEETDKELYLTLDEVRTLARHMSHLLAVASSG